jgi:hypothetical protein
VVTDNSERRSHMSSYPERKDRDAEVVDRTQDKAGKAAQEAERPDRNLADRAHDTVEDAIPGDSDNDGH